MDWRHKMQEARHRNQDPIGYYGETYPAGQSLILDYSTFFTLINGYDIKSQKNLNGMFTSPSLMH